MLKSFDMAHSLEFIPKSSLKLEPDRKSSSLASTFDCAVGDQREVRVETLDVRDGTGMD